MQFDKTSTTLSSKSHDAAWRKMGEVVASFDAGCLLWLTQYTATEDKHWLAKGTLPVAPFPNKSYFAAILKFMLENDRLFIAKSREMMTSWLSCGYIAWMCQWFPQVEWIVQTEKEDKAKELINYCRILYHRQEAWMKDRVQVMSDRATELKLSNGSRVLAVPKGVNQIRLYHPFGYFMDEAAFLPEGRECFNVVHPVAKQIIAVSSAGPGWFADECEAKSVSTAGMLAGT